MDQKPAPPSPEPVISVATTIWGVVTTASMALSAYHGYRRNDSLGWALAWGFMGTLFPVLTPTVALAQGFGEPAQHAPPQGFPVCPPCGQQLPPWLSGSSASGS